MEFGQLMFILLAKVTATDLAQLACILTVGLPLIGVIDVDINPALHWPSSQQAASVAIRESPANEFAHCDRNKAAIRYISYL